MEKPKASRRHQLNIKARKNDFSAFEDFRAFAQHFPNDYETLKHLISLETSSSVIQFQKCERFNEIPKQPDYIECATMNEKKKTISSRTLTRQYCYFGCPSSSIIKVVQNLEAKKEGLEREIEKRKEEIPTLEKTKKGLVNEIANLELKKIELTQEDSGLMEGIKNLRKIAKDENLKEKMQILSEKHNENLKKQHEIEIKEKDETIKDLRQQIEDLMKEKTEFSKIEITQPKTESQTTAKATFETETIQTIERRKIALEKPQSLESIKILCPKTNQEVSVKEQCNMAKCDVFLKCEAYVQRIKALYGDMP